MGLVAASAPNHAGATYSILAVDARDGTVGGVVASCVPLDTVMRVYGAVPGQGALVTQSYLKDEAMPDGLAWIATGSAPEAVVAALIDPAYDPDFELRQYAVVSVDGRAAGFTGSDANPHASNIVFQSGDFSVAIQGNYLTGAAVLAQARDGFEAEGACDLPERLMRALEAAGSNGAGDARCVSGGAPAESALLQVDPPGQATGSYLRIGSPMSDAPPSENPVPGLRALFDQWRLTHGCPAPYPDDPPPPEPADPAASPTSGCHATHSEPAGGPTLFSLILLAAISWVGWRRPR